MDKQNTPDTVVALYRLSSEGWDYYHNLTFGTQAIKCLLDDLPEIFANAPGTPNINTKTMQQLEFKLRNALKEFSAGTLADVRVCFPVGEDMRAFGFHRMPVGADRDTQSLLAIAMNRFGHLSESRWRPTLDALAVKAAVFGCEVHHVH